LAFSAMMIEISTTCNTGKKYYKKNVSIAHLVEANTTIGMVGQLRKIVPHNM